MSEGYDYTAGESTPEDALNAENFSIGGSGAVDYDSKQIEAENSFHDLEPGNYLLRVTGFGKIDLKPKSTYINGQCVQYNAPQVEVRLADANDPGGRIRAFFLLPPDDPTFLRYYNQGGNEKGSPQSKGFFAKQFRQFVDNLFPGTAYTTVKGQVVLSDEARSLANWKGRLIWAQVEMGKASANVDPTTGDPYPARAQIKMFSYRAHEEGGKSPYNDKPRAGAPAGGHAPLPGQQSFIDREPAVNGAAVAAAAGLDDI